MRHVFIAIGSNQPSGDISPAELVANTPSLLARRGWRAVRASRRYRNAAWPPGSGAPDYVNAVIEVEGEGSPEGLLAELHEVEAATGRRRGARYLPRTLDLDLIAWGEEVRPDLPTVRRWIDARAEAALAVPPELILPHPRLQERAFVLVPLAEVAPDWRHPVLGSSAAELRDALPRAAVAELAAL